MADHRERCCRNLGDLWLLGLLVVWRLRLQGPQAETVQVQDQPRLPQHGADPARCHRNHHRLAHRCRPRDSILPSVVHWRLPQVRAQIGGATSAQPRLGNHHHALENSALLGGSPTHASVEDDRHPRHRQAPLQARARAAPQELQSDGLLGNQHAPPGEHLVLQCGADCRGIRLSPRHCAWVHHRLRRWRLAWTRRFPVARIWRLLPHASSCSLRLQLRRHARAHRQVARHLHQLQGGLEEGLGRQGCWRGGE
mmetsp:Transcript_54374/g.156347  ORF Transcript_54374/g.156347 Transcript_54374/m.156347 type:complete len:253 (-) Transcript_54374:194-952(-)